MIKKIEQTFPYLLAFLLFSMPLSMAGIEAFSWTMLVFWVIYRSLIYKEQGLVGLRVPGFSFFLLYLAVMIFGAFTAEHFSMKEKMDVLGDGRIVLLVLMYFDLFQRKLIDFKKMMLPLCLSLGIVFLFGIFQFFTGSDPFRDVVYNSSFHYQNSHFWRVKGFYSTPMTFGNTMAMWFAFAACLLVWPIRSIKKGRRFFIFIALFSGWAFIFSFVRGAWIGVIITGLLLTLIKRPKMFLLVLVANAVVLGAAYLTVLPIQQRVDHTLSGEDSSMKDRLLIWNYYGNLFLKNPILGAGHRFTGKLMERENIISTGVEAAILKEHAHSNYLQLLAGLGLFGFIGFYGFFLTVFFRSLYFLKSSKASLDQKNILMACVAALLCFHFSSLTEATILDWEVVHIYALMLGLSLHLLKANDEGHA